ncbi:MAG: Polysaccharide biosynthesis/export protein [Syntrophorhabdus sp. PtaU1.Bin153]|nr:MAG: Polysaccharide biosynthesis/export protein [Syntrophorhabdus sp. PtaU1.Bin153]
MSLKLLVCLIFSALFLTACWPSPNMVINPTPLTQFTQPDPAKKAPAYLIGVGDTLDIKFMYNPELNELAVPVRPDGRISLQLANDVPAANLTPEQLRKALIEKYSAEIKKPEIAVIIRSFTGNRVFVDGEVVLPGMVEIRGPTSLMQVLSQAHGLRETARMSNVIVIRKDAEGKPMAANVDIRKVINGTDMTQDIAMLPYDIVYVPKSNIANWLKFVDEYINRAVPGGFPGWSEFYNPYTYSFGGFTKVYPDTGVAVVAPGP